MTAMTKLSVLLAAVSAVAMVANGAPLQPREAQDDTPSLFGAAAQGTPSSNTLSLINTTTVTATSTAASAMPTPTPSATGAPDLLATTNTPTATGAPDLLATETPSAESAAPSASASVSSTNLTLNSVGAVHADFSALDASSVIAPQVAVVDVDAQGASARQTILNLVIGAANKQATQAAASAMTPTLSALVSAHSDYVQTITTGRRRDANIDPARQLYIATLNHVATPEGTAMVQSLAASNQQYQSADAVVSVARDDHCSQLQQHFSGAQGQIDASIKECMCSSGQSYSLCRMLLAHNMHTNTQYTQSTGASSSIAALAQTVTNGTGVAPDNTAQLDSTNTWQPSDSLINSRRRGSGINPFNPLTGEISAGACFGEGFELCLKGGGYLPNFKFLTQSISTGDEMIVEQCIQGKCSQTPVADFAATAAAQAANVGAEISVSLCLGLPGLTETLNSFGISLCYNLITADFYPIQGPLGMLSTGLQLFIVKLSAFGKLKMANGAPVCPQDFNSDMQNYACKNPAVYDAFVNGFASNDYCNLQQGQGVLGASIIIDLWFWSKEFDFEQSINPRTPFTCTPNGQVASTGGAPRGDFGQFNCYEAQQAYLQQYTDVANHPYYGTHPREHYETFGINEGRTWHGELCLFENLDCWNARNEYYAMYPDVKANGVYGASGQLGHNAGAHQHFLDYGKGEGRYWHGDFCILDEICDAANADYLTRYADVASDPKWKSDPRGHYEQVGKAQLRAYLGNLCVQSTAECGIADTKYYSDYPDVKAAGVNAWGHYQAWGKAEGRVYHSELCTPTD